MITWQLLKPLGGEKSNFKFSSSLLSHKFSLFPLKYGESYQLPTCAHQPNRHVIFHYSQNNLLEKKDIIEMFYTILIFTVINRCQLDISEL